MGPKPAEDPTTWITVRPDGSFPHYLHAPYGQDTTSEFETWGCPNNPYFARLMEGRIRAQAETGIDGSYIDWTQIAGGTCYSTAGAGDALLGGGGDSLFAYRSLRGDTTATGWYGP